MSDLSMEEFRRQYGGQQPPPRPPDFQGAPAPPNIPETLSVDEFKARYPEQAAHPAISTSAPSKPVKKNDGNWFPEITDAAQGFVSNAARHVGGAYDLVRKGLNSLEPPQPTGSESGIDIVHGQRGKQLPPAPPQLTNAPIPDTTSGHLGAAGEDIAEYIVPGSKTSKIIEAAEALPAVRMATRHAPKLVKAGTAVARAGLDALTAAGVRTVQTGGNDPEGTKDVAKGAGALSLGGSALGAAVPAIKKALTPSTGNAFVTRLQQALRPQHPGFAEAVMRAGPEIKASEQELGTVIGKGVDPTTGQSSPNQGIQDFMDLVKHAKQRVWDQYQKVRGPLENTLHDTSPVADEVIKAIPETLRQQNPEAAQALIEKANTLRTQLPIQTVEKMLQEANGEVAAYEAKFPAMKRAALAGNPETAEAVARANGLRKVLYGAYEDPAEGAVAREFKKRYGALSEVELAAERAKIIADRQSPMNLNQQVSVGETARRVASRAMIGATAGAFQGHPILGGLAGAAEGAVEGTAGQAAANWARNRNSANNLLIKAFQKFEGMPAPPDAAPFAQAGKLPELEAGPRAPGQGPVPKRGPAGGIETEPIPDSSFVKGVPADVAEASDPYKIWRNKNFTKDSKSGLWNANDPKFNSIGGDYTDERLWEEFAKQEANQAPKQIAAPPTKLPPAPDTSFVKGEPAKYGTPVPGKLRPMLEAPPTPLPAAPDTSGITRVTPAAKQTGRDPATGKMFRYYTSQPNFPIEHLDEFAKANGYTPAQAQKALEDEGWQVGGPQTKAPDTSLPSSSAKTFNQEQLKNYAKQQKLNPELAKQRLVRRGYTEEGGDVVSKSKIPVVKKPGERGSVKFGGEKNPNLIKMPKQAGETQPSTPEEWKKSQPPEPDQPRNRGKFSSKSSPKSEGAQEASDAANNAAHFVRSEESRIKELSTPTREDYLKLRELSSKAAKLHRNAAEQNKLWYQDMPKGFQTDAPKKQAAYHEEEAQQLEAMARAPFDTGSPGKKPNPPKPVRK